MRQSRIHTQQYDGAVHRCRRTRARTRTHARISRFSAALAPASASSVAVSTRRTDGDAAVTLEFAGQLLDWQRFPGLIGIFGDGIFGIRFSIVTKDPIIAVPCVYSNVTGAGIRVRHGVAASALYSNVGTAVPFILFLLSFIR